MVPVAYDLEEAVPQGRSIVAEGIVIESVKVYDPQAPIVWHQGTSPRGRTPSGEPVDDTEPVPLGVTCGNASTRIGGDGERLCRVHIPILYRMRPIPDRLILNRPGIGDCSTS